MPANSVLDKVRKLLRLAQSPNPNEAAAAAVKAQQLIDEHNLASALLSLETGANEPDEPIEDFQKKDAPLDENDRDYWRWRLAAILMHANACAGYCLGGIQIMGRPSDVETVRYLYGYFAGEVNRLTEVAGKGCGRTWRNNYRNGIVDTLGARLMEQHAAFRAGARASVAGNTHALVKVDQALAKVEERRIEVDAFTKKHLNIRSVSAGGARLDASARAAGRRDGHSIRINTARGSIGRGGVRGALQA